MGFGTDMDRCGRIMKYSLFALNLVIFIFGLVLVGTSIYYIADNLHWISEITSSNMLSGTIYVILVSGVVISVISFLGCMGAIREVKCMLVTYFLIVFLMSVTLLIAGILGYIFREKFVDTLEREMMSSMRLYDQRRDIRTAWDTVQSQLHCCGVRNLQDWQRSGYNLPKSCCRQYEPGKYMNCYSNWDSLNPGNAYPWGCLDLTQSHLKTHSAVLGTLAVIAAILMFIGMAFSFSLFKLIE